MEKGEGVAEWERKSRKGRQGNLMRWDQEGGIVGVCGILSELPSTSNSPHPLPRPVDVPGWAGWEAGELQAMPMMSKGLPETVFVFTLIDVLFLLSLFVSSLYISFPLPLSSSQTHWFSIIWNACREDHVFSCTLEKCTNTRDGHLRLWSHSAATAAAFLSSQAVGRDVQNHFPVIGT